MGWDDDSNTKARLPVSQLSQDLQTAGVASELTGGGAVALGLESFRHLPDPTRATASHGLPEKVGPHAPTFARDGWESRASFESCRLGREPLRQEALGCGDELLAVFFDRYKMRVDCGALGRPRALALGVVTPRAEGEKQGEDGEHGAVTTG